ncbi:Crp/Fnr family transcriptional regulator [Chitinophaga sp. 22321]|uniref:Crp/Fnr family transcriptional regulator n=1 Tax=Chitinophaga hostae TaxID=2831022 RepID=A0ABS5IW43_9BACT|nr:Crp/Fnr family transcriptional regulator [Chitinophaga hostae]MBS0027174.1 Crp/Fnr family transcriptional regulator [Chitinophaga hostae]
MTNLLAYIRSLAPFSDQSWEMLSAHVTQQEFGKRAYLLKPGKVCNSLFFISKGYCKTSYDQDGQDINTGFYFECDIVTDINSFHKNEPATLSIQACEALTVIRFDKPALAVINRLSPESEAVGKKLMQLVATKQEEQIRFFRLLTVQKRYEYLEENMPGLLQRVSLTQLSSYLGVSRETLSRMRNKRGRS